MPGPAQGVHVDRALVLHDEDDRGRHGRRDEDEPDDDHDAASGADTRGRTDARAGRSIVRPPSPEAPPFADSKTTPARRRQGTTSDRPAPATSFYRRLCPQPSVHTRSGGGGGCGGLYVIAPTLSDDRCVQLASRSYPVGWWKHAAVWSHLHDAPTRVDPAAAGRQRHHTRLIATAGRGRE